MSDKCFWFLTQATLPLTFPNFEDSFNSISWNPHFYSRRSCPVSARINGAGWQMSRRETDSIVQIFIKLCLITPLKIENNPLLRVRGCESGLRWLQPSVCGSCSITDCHRWQAIVVDSKFTTDRCMHRKYAKVVAASDAQWRSVKSMHRADRALIIFLKRTCHMTTCLILMISISHSASIRIENIC